MIGSPDEVRTARLVLRRMETDDWMHLRRMDTDPEIMATLGGVRLEDETKAYVARQVEHWDEYGFGWWTIFNAETGDFAGRGGCRFIELEGRMEAEVGYGLLPEYWGMGLATEIATEAVQVGLSSSGAPRLVGITLPTNHASRRVLLKVGFAPAGTALYEGFECDLFAMTCEPGT